MDFKNDPNKMRTQDFYEKLMSATGLTGGRHFQERPEEEYQVRLKPDKSVSRAKFLPIPGEPGIYKAHPVTIRAMRKDLFVGGAEMFEDLEAPYTCHSCQASLDLQFWLFCPYCETEPKATN